MPQIEQLDESPPFPVNSPGPEESDPVAGPAVTAEAAARTAAITAHLGDALDAHDAAAVSVAALSSLAGTDVQAVLADLDTRVPAVESGSLDELHVPSGVEVLSAQTGYPIPAGTEVISADQYGNFGLGPNELIRDFVDGTPTNFNKSLPTFFYDAHSRVVYAFAAVFGTPGDPSEIRLRRAGPDDQYPVPTAGVDAMTGLLSGTSIGFIRWDPFCTPNGGTPGVTLGGSFQTGSVQIGGKLAENAFDHFTGGRLQIMTTPIGSGTLAERIMVEPNGNVLIGTTNDGGRLKVVGSDATKPVVQILAPAGQSAKIVEVYAASGSLALDFSDGGTLRLPLATAGLVFRGDVALDFPNADQMRLATDDSFLLGGGVGTGKSFFQLFEQSAAPSAAPANGARLFAFDDGAGNTELRARFASGASRRIVSQADPPPIPAAAEDLGSAIALANALRTAALTAGLGV